ncbi:MAG TPA: cyclic nucleotide-binding domain-containing protein [Polyangiaceae bacterium]
MTEPLSSRFPEPLDNDDDDVAWALQTAKVMWQRGAQADAIVWLRRAADTADQQSNVWRAADLRRAADELTTTIGTRPPFSRPPPVSTSGRRGSDIDALLSARPEQAPLPAYAPVDEHEMEVEPESFDEIVIEEPESRIELISELEQELLEDDETDDDEIDDDELDPVQPLPSFPIEASVNPGMIDYEDGDDPVTQPQLDDPLAFPSSRRPLAQLGLRPEPEEDPHIGDLVIGEVRGLEDLPPEAQARLVREVQIESLSAQEEVSAFGLALVLKGAVDIMPAIADLACARAAKGDIIWGEGNLEEGVALRLVAAESGTDVAVWDATLIKDSVRDSPWVVDDLKALADRFQALAGVAMGPMGERLDDSLRSMVTGRCEIKRLLPNEVLATKGQAVGGMYIVAAGRIEIVDGEAIEDELGPGDFMFGAQVLSNGKAPRDARAGKGGALVLFAGRSVAHDLLLSVPPLLEIFAS